MMKDDRKRPCCKGERDGGKKRDMEKIQRELKIYYVRILHIKNPLQVCVANVWYADKKLIVGTRKQTLIWVKANKVSDIELVNHFEM